MRAGSGLILARIAFRVRMRSERKNGSGACPLLVFAVLLLPLPFPGSSSPHLVVIRCPGNRAAILRAEIHGHGSHSFSDVRFGHSTTARRSAVPWLLVELIVPQGDGKVLQSHRFFRSARLTLPSLRPPNPKRFSIFLREYHGALCRWSVSMRARSRCSLQPGMTPVPSRLLNRKIAAR